MMRSPLMPTVGAFLLLALANLFTLAPTAFAADIAVAEQSLHGEYSVMGALHRTGGAGDRTLLHRGEFTTQELELDLEQPLPAEWSLTANAHGRITDDEQIDNYDGVHVLGWTTELYNPFLHFTGGNFFADYSQYTAQQSLTGVQAALTTDRVESKGAFGYSQRDIEGVQYRRYVTAARSEVLITSRSGPLSDFRVGGNFSDVEDGEHTIENKTGVLDASNRVGSVNAHLLLWDISDFAAELAKSWNDDDTTPGSTVDRNDGTALRVNNITKFSKKDKLRLGYEWVTPDFNTLAGSATPDRVNFTSRYDHRWNTEWSANAGYRVFCDKLDKSSLAKRTVTQSPRTELNWEPDSTNWLLKDNTWRIFWEERSRISQDDPVSGQTDFKTNDTGFENEFRVDKVHFSDGWSLSIEDDDQNKINDRVTNSAYFGMRMHDKLLGINATPSLKYQMDYADIPKSEGRDLTQTVSQALRLDISDALKFDERLSLSNASRLAPDADAFKCNAYLGIDYKLPVPQDLTFRANYEFTGFAHEASTQRFAEHNFETKLILKF